MLSCLARGNEPRYLNHITEENPDGCRTKKRTRRLEATGSLRALDKTLPETVPRRLALANFPSVQLLAEPSNPEGLGSNQPGAGAPDEAYSAEASWARLAAMAAEAEADEAFLGLADEEGQAEVEAPAPGLPLGSGAPGAEPPSAGAAGASGRAEGPILDTLWNLAESGVVAAENATLALPGFGQVPAVCDLFNTCWANPEGPVKTRLEQWHAWYVRTWQWADECLSAHLAGVPKRLRGFIRRRARAVPECGKVWEVPTCNKCGHELTARAFQKFGCGAQGCSVCDRDKARAWQGALAQFAETHPILRVKGEVSRDYCMHVFGPPIRPWFSVRRFREDMNDYQAEARAVWHECRVGADDAGSVAFAEVGPRGGLHGHMLSYGAWTKSVHIRSAATDVLVQRGRLEPGKTAWTRDVPVYDKNAPGHRPKGAKSLGNAIREVAKYPFKASTTTGRLREFVHPLLVVLAEIALCDRPRVQGYGSMSGIKALYEKKRNEEKKSREKNDFGACPVCGANDWTTRTQSKQTFWIPGGRRSRPKRE